MFKIGDLVRANANYNEGSLEGSEGTITKIMPSGFFPYRVEFDEYCVEYMSESEIELCES